MRPEIQKYLIPPSDSRNPGASDLSAAPCSRICGFEEGQDGSECAGTVSYRSRLKNGDVHLCCKHAAIAREQGWPDVDFIAEKTGEEMLCPWCSKLTRGYDCPDCENKKGTPRQPCGADQHDGVNGVK